MADLNAEIAMKGSPGSQPLREAPLLPRLIKLVDYHRRACPAYARILAAIGHPPARHYEDLRELPWLPVRLFKEHPLVSTEREQVAVLTSSGTTGTGVTQIALDRDAAERQRLMLIATLEKITGPRRLPLLIIDSPSSVRAERSSIRGATVLGVMNVGREHVFALDDQQHIDANAVEHFLQRHAHAAFLIFGFTSLVWTRFYELARTRAFDLGNALLLHTGGWKKLADQAVSPQVFRTRFREDTGLVRCHNFYGMVEQGGTIHLESASGDGLYCPDSTDVIVRDTQSWEEAAVGTPGVIEVLSSACRAHPGHVLLTEDLGVVHGVDDGEWPGKRFSVLGRLARAEPRGCSDTRPETRPETLLEAPSGGRP
jgi:hypothetical protein